MKNQSDKSDEIEINAGGINLKCVIDSGASVNIISSALWENLKSQKIKCKSEKSNKKLYAYGSDSPLEVVGKFSCEVYIQNQSKMKSAQAEFYVVRGNGVSLLGKATAIELGVLKLGIYSVNEDIKGKYCDIFKGVGKLENFKLKLHINSDVEPVAQRMYRIPFTLREKVERKLDELESQDIIEKVNDQTPWVSPVIVVPKPNGDIRLCVDMREANKAIVRERHPIPTVDEILYKMNGGEWFSKMDLRYGFHQLELEEKSREITTFVTHKGLYRYKRLMFGINAAPEKYQQVISQVFHDIEGVQNISDDIVVFGRTRQEHDQRLKSVLDRIREKKLTLNAEKCEFGMDKITFMGHVLSKNGIGPTSDRVKDIVNATEPTNGSEVKSFLGLVNFSARYIPNLATISEPLRQLTKKNQPFRWGKEQKESFQTLKQSLAEEKTLGYFKLNADKTQLITDASNVGLGAVLVQEHHGETKVVCYASRSLTETEKKYSTTEKEGLAVVWACEKFHLYLYGINFELLTDHKPLESLYDMKTTQNARIQRWMLKLLPYSYKIKYMPGKQNIADALSRLVVKNKTEFSEIRNVAEEYVRFTATERTPKALTTREIEEASKTDFDLSEVRKCLIQAKWNKSTMGTYFPIRNELCQIGYLLLRGTRIIIPEALRAKCIELAHEGHLGIVGTKQMLRSKVWWPSMDRDVEKYVKSCHGCQITGQFPNPEPLEPTSLPNGPWQYLAIDLLGPLPSGHSVLVVIDYYSRYYEIEITKDTSSEKMIDSLENIFLRHGLPLCIRSDNGPQFTSAKFEQYLRDIDVKHLRTTPLYPAANGEVERQNRSLMKRIRIAQAESRDWKQEVRKYLMAYRTKPHTVTGVSPAELLFKRKLRTKIPEVTSYEAEENVVLDGEIRDRDMIMKHKNKVYIDEKRNACESDLTTGDSVLVKQQYTDKMTTPYIPTPYKLVEKNGNQCVVQSPEGVNYRRNTTHVKKYNEVQTESESETPKSIPETDNVVTRPVRERKPPAKLNDYVVG